MKPSSLLNTDCEIQRQEKKCLEGQVQQRKNKHFISHISLHGYIKLVQSSTATTTAAALACVTFSYHTKADNVVQSKDVM